MLSVLSHECRLQRIREVPLCGWWGEVAVQRKEGNGETGQVFLLCPRRYTPNVLPAALLLYIYATVHVPYYSAAALVCVNFLNMHTYSHTPALLNVDVMRTFY